MRAKTRTHYKSLYFSLYQVLEWLANDFLDLQDIPLLGSFDDRLVLTCANLHVMY